MYSAVGSKPIYRLSYEDADELIELAPPQDRDLADLDPLNRRRNWRLNRGHCRWTYRRDVSAAVMVKRSWR